MVLKCLYETCVYFAFHVFEQLGYGLDGPEFEYRSEDIFSYPYTSRPSLKAHPAFTSMGVVVIF
jgi:hypothetical protein